MAVLGQAHCVASGSYDGKVAIYDWNRDEWPAVHKVSRFGISSLAADEVAGEFLATSYDGHVYRLPQPVFAGV